MDPDTSTSQGRRLLPLLLAVAVLAVLVWALVAGGPGGPQEPSAATTSAGPADAAAPRGTTATPGPADPTAAPEPGAPPSPGEGRTVPVEAVPVLPAVGLDATGDFGTGLTVRLTAIEAVDGVARAPGEVAGPALAVTLRAANDSTGSIPLDDVVVLLSYGQDRTPATDLGQGSTPLSGSLSAGASATGTYVFAVPEDVRDDLRVEIAADAAPTVAFAGSLD
ncbi:hypothetical protein FHE66_01505 [Georgenia sp. 311]|uniref:hypothetical protein n=1 Tax=Georgenia sp. 311 TaxID=2585134 RepID=UPI001112A5DF|nr:hypothetical protein [Georgenia sp. 311]TNC20148.1 hypothetical protein FHE66_01505 [Georgenia sp. 311]